MEDDWNARGDIAQTERLRDWLESQSTVLSYWIDRLVDEADLQTAQKILSHKQEVSRLLGSL